MSTELVTPTPTARPQLDRFLIAILVGLVALFTIAGIALLVRQPPSDLPADTPGGTVQRFYKAIAQEDYKSAYLLLSDNMTKKPTESVFTEFNTSQHTYSSDRQNEGVRIANEKIVGDTAYLDVAFTRYYNNPGPFGGSDYYTYTESFTLQRESGTWRITKLPYTFVPYNY